MAASATATATATSSEVSEGPVLNFINKRLRSLRKKLNRISQMEQSISQGKTLNKEQEEVFKSKLSVISSIEELEKLRQPLTTLVAEEIDLAIQCKKPESNETKSTNDQESNKGDQDFVIEDVLKLIYFAGIFDVKSKSDFESVLLTRSHERGCCLSYDHVDDDDVGELLGENDLDLISKVGSLLVSRPVDTGLSHKDALEKCVEHAKLWLSSSPQPIEKDSNVTYALLKEKLAKIMASPYVTTMPEMKKPVEVVGGNYGSFQAQGEGFDVHYQQKDEDLANYEVNESSDNQAGPVDELQKGEYEVENSTELPAQSESVQPQPEREQVESKEQQFNPRRQFQNRGRGGGARRGYSNGRGGGARRGGGPYQNGRNQYNDQPGNYYPRNTYYTNRDSRGGGRGAAGNFNNHGSAVPSES